MKRDYKYAIYVLALATVVTLATGLLVVAGDPSTDDTQHAQLDDSDVELVGDLEALSDAERDRLPRLVLGNETVRSYFDETDGLTFEVSERRTYDEAADEFVPVGDTVMVEVSPTDGRLPYAFVTVDPDAETVSVEQAFRSLDEPAVAFDDGRSRLTADERDRLERILLDDPDVRWELKTLLDEPESVDVAVVDRDDERVGVAVTAADGNASTVHADVDLASETVVDQHVTGTISVAESGSVDAANGSERAGRYVLTENASGSVSIRGASESDGSAGEISFEVENGTETAIDLEDVTVSLTDRRDAFSAEERERLAERVWSTDAVREPFDDPERVEMSVSRDREFDAETGTFTPAETATVRVTPPDGRLPHVVAVVGPDDGTVSVTRALPALDDVDLAVTDDADALTDADRGLLEELVETDESVGYTVQSQFDDPDELHATVTDAAGDTVTVTLAPPDVEGTAVSLTVDLEDGTVTRSFVVIESLEVETVDGDGGEYGVEISTAG